MARKDVINVKCPCCGEVLEIESAGGAMTLVRFHEPVLPEQLDGYA